MSAPTFAVSDVKPSREACRTTDPKTFVEALGGKQVEACSTYQGDLVACEAFHALFSAAHTAFARHYPLVLTPDIIWLTIEQGVALHVRQNAEHLRSRLVAREGRHELDVRRDDFVRRSPENPWPDVFATFSEQIRARIDPKMYELLVADFSTTGTVERAASEVVLMDVFQSYFGYLFETMCGIPTITLEGTVEDWERIDRRIDGLERFDLGWWTKHLRRLTGEFVRAAKGHVDITWWTSIYKEGGGSGGPYISGWLGWLLPYLNVWDRSGERIVRNEFLGKPGNFTHNNLVSSLSRMPMVWNYHSEKFAYELLAGLIGVRQETESLSIRPVVGWAVQPADAPPAEESGHRLMKAQGFVFD